MRASRLLLVLSALSYTMSTPERCGALQREYEERGCGCYSTVTEAYEAYEEEGADPLILAKIAEISTTRTGMALAIEVAQEVRPHLTEAEVEQVWNNATNGTEHAEVAHGVIDLEFVGWNTG